VKRWLVLVSVLAAACSGGGGGTPLPSGSRPSDSRATSAAVSPTGPFDTQYATDPRSPVTWLVKPSGKAEDDEILAAYRHLVFVIHRLGAKPDPGDRELRTVTTGSALAFYTKLYADSIRKHLIQIGPGIVTSAAVRRSGNTVAVAACQDLRQSYPVENGKRDELATGFYEELAVLRKVNGNWVAIQVTGQLKDAC
jgi:hypothetical protein